MPIFLQVSKNQFPIVIQYPAVTFFSWIVILVDIELIRSTLKDHTEKYIHFLLTHPLR